MSSTEPACYRVGDLLVDPGRRRVERDGNEIALPGLTFDLLLALAREAPNLSSIDVLMQQVWPGRVVSPETVSQRVKLLRAALGDDPDSPRYLTGVRGHGYRLIVPVERCAIPTAVEGPAKAVSVALTESVTPAASPPPRRPVTRSPWPFVLALVLGAGLWLAWSNLRESPVSQVVPATLEAPPRSIAVLPFENRSRLEEDAYFVDGLHDDILTQLTRIGGLTVISRTSVEQFRDTRLTIREIAARLGTSHILEGGVQRAGDRVRVTVQLVDTATDAHLWAESYDRRLDAESIFALQSEVATAVAAALHTTLTPAEQGRVKAVPTNNLEAWEAYQAGRKALSPRTPTGIAQARQAFQAAIELDPAFAQAYAGLADTIWLSAGRAGILGLKLEPAMVEVEALLQEALRLDPELVEAVTTTASIATERHDYARAEAGFRKAIELNSNYPTAHQWYAALLGNQGRHAEALQSIRRAVELDPMSTLMRVLLALHLETVGRSDEALTELNEAHERDPTSPLPVFELGILHSYGYNRFGPAIAFGEQAVESNRIRPVYREILAQMYLDLGDYERAEEVLDAAGTETSGAVTRTHLYLYRAEPEKARSSALAVIETHGRDWQSTDLLRVAALATNDPRSARALYERGFPELLAAPPAIDATNYDAAIDLALVLQKTGEAELAVELLRRAEAWVLAHPRLGMRGHGIADARIRLLLGQRNEALTMLQQAQQSGWRGPLWRYYRDFDPVLAPLRNEPTFKAVFDAIERDMARQRAALAAQPPGVPAPSVDAPTAGQ